MKQHMYRPNFPGPITFSDDPEETLDAQRKGWSGCVNVERTEVNGKKYEAFSNIIRRGGVESLIAALYGPLAEVPEQVRERRPTERMSLADIGDLEKNLTANGHAVLPGPHPKNVATVIIPYGRAPLKKFSA